MPWARGSLEALFTRPSARASAPAASPRSVPRDRPVASPDRVARTCSARPCLIRGCECREDRPVSFRGSSLSPRLLEQSLAHIRWDEQATRKREKLTSKQGCSPILGLYSLLLSGPPHLLGRGWGSCPVWGVLRSQARGGWAPASQAWPGPGPLSPPRAWGHEEGSPQPTWPLLPAPLPLLSLCRNQEIPVQRQETGLFLALWGEKRMLPFCSKVYGVCAGQTSRSMGL